MRAKARICWDIYCSKLQWVLFLIAIGRSMFVPFGPMSFPGGTRVSGPMSRPYTECFLKSTCAFLCVFFIIIVFSAEIFEKCFFWQKKIFSAEPPIFSGKHHYFEGFGHKEVKFLSKLFCTYFLKKKFGIKFPPACTLYYCSYLLIW